MRLDIPEHKILVHETSLPILWGDMDSLGHVNNTIYFKYMEQARVTWIEAMTGSLTDAKEGPVIANAFFNFYQPLVFPGDLLIKLYVASPGRTSIDTFVTIERRDEPGQHYAAGGPLVVSCGNQRRQSVVVVAPCGHVGKSQSGLSTCPCGLVVHELEAVS